MDSEGAELVPLAAGPVAAPGDGVGRAFPALEVDETWLIVDPFHPDFGIKRNPLPSAPAAGLHALVVDSSGRPAAAKKVKDSEGGFLEAARKWLDDVEAADRGERKDGGLEARLRRALDGGTASPVSGEDARTLPANFDEHGGRTGREMKLLTEILCLSGTYDQNSDPSLACIDAVSRRVRLVIE
ncbi:unnamed protein product, partial [Prorocentrum cordatum]